MRRQERTRLASQVEPGADAELVHLRRRHRADAMKFADRQRFHEGRTHLRRDDEQAVRLAVVGGQLREELVVGHAGGSGQTGLPADRGPDFLCDRGRRASVHQRIGHVEIGLVQRQRLDQRRVACEDGADLLRHRPVDVKARRHEHELGAFAPGRDRGHRRVHAEFARLVTRGSHHPARPRRRQQRPARRAAPDRRAAPRTRRKRPCRCG